uniref:Inhibitor_I29 domain-containing protein n=1 Tax=Angiostrongylus cantonensis TaxID=6313 RepID=A0A0K0DQQ4_ANGCA
MWIPASTMFVVYAPALNYDEEEIKAFYMDWERFYREDIHSSRSSLEISMPRSGQEDRLRNRQRWTWESPNGEYHNEIDHIIVNRKVNDGRGNLPMESTITK